MFDNVIPLLPEIGISIVQTFLMVGIAIGAALLFGTPLGILLFLTSKGQLLERPILFRVINSVVNIVRSFPFLILLVALIPLTRVLIGTTIGPVAAAVPLSIAAIPYFARLVEQSLREVSKGVIEAAVAMGASTYQIIWKVLIVEARSGLMLGLTVLIVSFLSYSAMAGVVGGGGIGDLAIRFGYYRFQTDVMVVTVLLLVALVQIIQFTGNRLAHYLDKR
ncbi:methionine ABC transporter permease [Aneurinibacillus aneurinilyticus]|jgi:D-methionine transport system permease protein|uniref:ABC transporter permease n=2 Tax=Aneurinibacillus aneurinilyticus TaxID=1391 RepID=A0A848CKD0_ANEAE|nr:methionine ABC transporter permease [Aneurinibacillus aneurinilyticus]ERI10263.1 ABC transporter, permease protein [Aneurinibacillus aneurinilyticus ATCC 12856]MCI1696430.1 ABC transporter permease [Aneurinibacillus aneurinilyticus]MED0671760.1 ABC transporter permease [Aneurinibacillus aneurinilyticus]MED0704539.1 ABC transporter permease [Aneurinibacillus aneurinilyticus]MED0725249.1 ABC transporter permease [Aneurinibacillus aneurinilyticus]